jgi:hypothetical protein
VSGAALLENVKEDLIGKPFEAAAAFTMPGAFRVHLNQCVERNARVTSHVTLTLKEGGQRILRMITDPVRRSGGKVKAYRTVLMDVTEEKRFEEELMLLSNLGAVLVSALDYTQALDASARVLVPALADILKIDLTNEDGEVRRFLVLFADPQKQEALAEKLKEFSGLRNTSGQGDRIG